MAEEGKSQQHLNDENFTSTGESEATHHKFTRTLCNQNEMIKMIQ